MTNPNLIAEARATLDGVTPGPWEYRPMQHDDWGVVRAGQFQICQARNPENMDDDVLDSCRTNKIDPWSANARFIAWCREGVPTLVSALEAAEADLRKVTEQQDKAIAGWSASQDKHSAALDRIDALRAELDDAKSENASRSAMFATVSAELARVRAALRYGCAASINSLYGPSGNVPEWSEGSGIWVMLAALGCPGQYRLNEAVRVALQEK